MPAEGRSEEAFGERAGQASDGASGSGVGSGVGGLSEVSAGIREVAVDSVRPNPHQPRRSFDAGRLAELAESLKANGLIQPIVLRGAPGGVGYQLIAGERRLRAAKLAGLKTIPAVVRDVDSLTQAQLALVENIQREDLNPLDRAEGYQALIEQLGLTQAELAGRLGEDRGTIANHLRLLKLAEPVRQLIRDGKLSLGHAKVIAGVEQPEDQVRLAQLVIGQSLSVRNLERKLAEGTPAFARREPSPENHLRDLEGRLTRQLGMKVKLAGGKGGRGRLTIAYANLDQFDALCERLGVLPE